MSVVLNVENESEKQMLMNEEIKYPAIFLLGAQGKRELEDGIYFFFLY